MLIKNAYLMLDVFFSKNSECFYKLNKQRCTWKWDKREDLATNATMKVSHSDMRE